MLEAVDLGRRFGPRWIFRHVAFELKQGDRLAVLGRNGAGKSTFLRVLAGLLPASEGEVRLPAGDRRNVLGISALEMAVYPHLTVGEHLQLAADLRGIDAREGELLETVRLAYAKSTEAGSLSTGMKARLRLALALQSDPEVLLLDEPGAGLDSEGREILAHVADLQASRGCLVIATNDPSERRLANLALEIGD